MAVDLFLVLALGACVTWLSHHYRFPNAVAQILLGVLIGPSLLQWVADGPALRFLGEIGVVLLLGVAGLELGLNRLRAAGRAGATAAALAMGFSFTGGYLVAWLFAGESAQALYVGLALATTSVGVIVQVLSQYHLMSHPVAVVLIAAAVIEDVAALYFLGALHGVLSGGSTAIGILGAVAFPILTLGGVFLLARHATRWAWQRGWVTRASVRAGWILIAVLASASLTQVLGYSAVVGGFFAGVGVGEGLAREPRRSSARALGPLVLLTIPFFFVMIGVGAQWSVAGDPATRGLVAGLLFAAVVGKALGGVLGAVGVGRFRDRWLIGFGMIAKGEVGLVIASLAFDQGHLAHQVHVALILTISIVTIASPMCMAPLAKRIARA